MRFVLVSKYALMKINHTSKEKKEGSWFKGFALLN
uniref:Uncharacterized protein n=1 Tax=Arundo donax TaxID=35708 RepID=A0A0A9B6R7_ARUDO